MFLLKLLELLHAPRMPSFAEWSRQKHADDLANFVFIQQIRAEAQDVAMIVLATEAGGDFVVRQRRPDAFDLVGGHRHADAAAVEEDAGFTLAPGHGLSGWDGEIGIIGGGGGAI